MVAIGLEIRGAAGVMAADLARTPSTGLKVQSCGDCHLMNFGGFATPERNIIFDINDFDETSTAPWEWDVKRLVASIVLAARSIGLSDSNGRDCAVTAARSYPGYLGSSSDEFDQSMAKFALAYADQAERDHAALKAAVRKGKLNDPRL